MEESLGFVFGSVQVDASVYRKLPRISVLEQFVHCHLFNL